MAGLVAALELQRAGHDPVIIEAQGRVGGCVLTIREPFSDGLFAEGGAMRIPRSHDLTMAYVERFGLATLPFTVSNADAPCYLNGTKLRMGDAEEMAVLLGYGLAPAERATTVGAMWSTALAPFAAALKAEGEAAWPDIVARNDAYSTREFLEARG